MPARAVDNNDDEDIGNMTVAELRKKIKTEVIKDEGEDVVQILALLGADPRSYRREKKQAVRRLVSEVYSPPRVTELLRHMSNHGLTPGLALDLTCTDPEDGKPWDFDMTEKREKADGSSGNRSRYSSLDHRCAPDGARGKPSTMREKIQMLFNKTKSEH